MFVTINGKLCYLWRAVDHEGDVLETVVTAKRDKAADAQVSEAHHEEIRPTAERRHRRPLLLSAAMKEIGNADRHEVGRRLNNRAENSHQPFRRRERAMQLFRKPSA
jgi:putative transposase